MTLIWQKSAFGNWLQRKLRKDTFGYRTSILAGGTALGQVLALLAAPILTRLYTVQDFGNLQAYVTILGFGFVVVAMRYELAILLPTEEAEAANVVVLGLVTVLLTSLAYAGLLGMLLIFDLFPAAIGPVHSYLWLVPVSMGGAGVYLVLSYWALRQKEYVLVAKTKVTQAVGQIATQLILGAGFKLGFLGLLLGDAIGRVSGSLLFIDLVKQRSRQVFRAVTWRGMWKVALRYKSFPLVSSGSALINTAGFGVPILLIGSEYGGTVLGWFALVDRIMNVPLAIIGQAVAQVYMAEASALAGTDPAALRQLFLRRLGQLALLALIPFLIVFVSAPWFVSLVFGESWREAGYFARILVPMNYVGFVVWPLMSTLSLLERQKWQFGWDVARLLITTTSLTAAHGINGDARMAVAAYGFAMLVCYALHAYLSYKAIGCRIPRTESITRQDNQP